MKPDLIIRLEYDLLEDKKKCKLKTKNIKIVCPICGFETNSNGCTGHAKKHIEIYEEKNKKLLEFYNFQKFCYCGNEINPIGKNRGHERSHTHFCSNKCFLEANKKVNKYYLNLELKKECEICGKKYQANNKNQRTCSYKCGIQLISNNSKKMGNNFTQEQIEERNKKIIKNRDGSKYIPAWNKGLKGKEYLKHYIKKDGTNSLYEGLKKNEGGYYKSNPEKIFENILNELKINYKYNFFVDNSQFDFFIDAGKIKYIVEIDGDYGHKSKRKFPDIEDRKIIILSDKLKEKKLNNLKFKNGDLLRIGEYDINNNKNKIKNLIKEIIYNENKKAIYEIKKYYEDWR